MSKIKEPQLNLDRNAILNDAILNYREEIQYAKPVIEPVPVKSGIDWSLVSLPAIKQPVIGSVPKPNLENTQEKTFPYLVLEEFIIQNKWENKIGDSGIYEIPIIKHSIVFLPTTIYKEQYEKALKDGKLKKLEYVTVRSLIDKESGKCNLGSSLIQTDYNPCRRVKKGQVLNGYIHPINNTFNSDGNQGYNVIRTLSKGEYELIGESGKAENVFDLKNNKKLVNGLLIVAGAVILYKVIKK